MKSKSSIWLDNNKLNEYIKNGWKVIDVRSTYELTYLPFIEGSTNIPYPGVIDNMETLFPNKDEKLIMVCNAGNRSSWTAEQYRQNGYKNVYVLRHGISGLNI